MTAAVLLGRNIGELCSIHQRRRSMPAWWASVQSFPKGGLTRIARAGHPEAALSPASSASGRDTKQGRPASPDRSIPRGGPMPNRGSRRRPGPRALEPARGVEFPLHDHQRLARSNDRGGWITSRGGRGTLRRTSALPLGLADLDHAKAVAIEPGNDDAGRSPVADSVAVGNVTSGVHPRRAWRIVSSVSPRPRR